MRVDLIREGKNIIFKRSFSTGEVFTTRHHERSKFIENYYRNVKERSKNFKRKIYDENGIERWV